MQLGSRQPVTLRVGAADLGVRLRTLSYGHHDIVVAMTTIRAADVRIPLHAREAVARHEQVTVMNRERPAFVIVHPDDTPAVPPPARRGRPLREALGILVSAALPDPGFADDMEAVLADVGPVPDDPWARS
jgi:hypothetical protein